MADELLASDKLRARDNGEWGRTKLEFLENFGPPALKATVAKRSRHYVDLFAGPGVNIIRDSGGEEFEGSPLRALQLTTPDGFGTAFTHAALVNRDGRDHRALEQRVRRAVREGRSRVPLEDIDLLQGNSNQVIYSILRKIDPRAYVFVFADLEAIRQLPWQTVEALRKYRDHESVDLYMLFPLDMGIKRLVSYNPSSTESCAPALTEFFGTDEWRQLVRFRESSAFAADLGRRLEKLYLTRLEKLWRYVDVVAEVTRGERHRLYKMILASDHPAGAKIGKWAKKKTKGDSSDQFDLGF